MVGRCCGKADRPAVGFLAAPEGRRPCVIIRTLDEEFAPESIGGSIDGETELGAGKALSNWVVWHGGRMDGRGYT